MGNRLRAGWRLTIQLIVNIGFYLVLILIASRSGTSAANSFWGIIVLAFAVTGLTLFSVWLAGRFLDRRHFSDFGIHLKNREWWADIGFVLVLGLVLPIGVAFLGNVVGWITVESVFASGITGIAFIPAIIVSAYLYICIRIYEEVARAYHIRNLFEGSQWLGLLGAMAVAIVGASAISVIMHRGNKGTHLSPNQPYRHCSCPSRRLGLCSCHCTRLWSAKQWWREYYIVHGAFRRYNPAFSGSCQFTGAIGTYRCGNGRLVHNLGLDSAALWQSQTSRRFCRI